MISDMKTLLLLLLQLTATFAVVLRDKPRYHEQLTKRELSQVFGVASPEHVPHYDAVNVNQRNVKLNNQGNVKLNHQANIVLNAFGTKLRLNLTLNKNFISKSHTIEFYGANGKVEKYLGIPGEFTRGHVEGDEHSHVALHHTDKGITGSIKTSDDFYIINPLPNRLSADSDVNHIIYRQTDLSKGHPLHMSGCGVEKDVENKFHYTRRVRRATQTTKTIELMMAADYKMVEHYTKDFLPTYVLSLANILSGLYQDTSLAYKIDVVVTRTVIFETNRFEASSIDNLLAGFSSWVKENNSPDDNNPSHVDNAVLMSRDGCADGCTKEGLAYGSPCSASAQSVSKDRGLMSALTVAHETAHNLGVGHDGGSTGCADGENMMATGSATGSSSFHWSTCSSKQVASFLESASSSCLDDTPAEHQSNASFQLYGTVFTADKQCEFAFGSDYRKCAYYESRCDQLYCQPKDVTGSCIGRAYPPVHGTYCGSNKWCIFGQCVPDGTRPPQPIDGSWGEWGEYNSCNRECGIGVQWKSRKCNNPAPANGGRQCEGLSVGHHKTCNTQPCPPETPSFRLEQCLNLNKDFKDFFDRARTCQLVCGTPASAFYYGKVQDGTKCTPGSDVNDVCVNGACQTIGCDLELNSGNVIDRCGVCKGNGNTCQLFTGSDYNPYPSQGQYHLVDIPAQSTGIKVKEEGGTFNFIGFKVGDSSSLAINLPSFSVSYELGNAKILYNMEGYYFPDEITVIGKIPQKIRTYLVNIYRVNSEGVKWQYYAPVTNVTLPTPTYEWQPQAWGPCSKSCAGGTQQRILSCVRLDDVSVVSSSLCESLEKHPTEQRCNVENCPASWQVTPWSPCSKSCGTGSQTRNLYCSQLTQTGEYNVVDNSECTVIKPELETSRQCNVVMCPSEWKILAWSECSKTCGEGGVQTRSVTCQRVNADGQIVTADPLECSYLKAPSAKESCNTDVMCPVWKGVYSECSVTCGNGIETGSVVCTAPPLFTARYPESECSTEEKLPLPENKVCHLASCDNDYHWIIHSSVCSVSCGAGVITATLMCSRMSTDATVADSFCPATKPNYEKVKNCDAGSCPEVYLWNVKKSACSVTCGRGLVSATPYCERQSDKVNVSGLLCEASTKPEISTEQCVLDACPIEYVYVVKHEECSVTCSKGVRKAKAVCQRKMDKVVVEVLKCSNVTEPTLVNKVCDMGTCPPTYSWKVRYSSCSVTCDQGSQTSISICVRDEDKQEMSSEMCDIAKRPESTTKPCNQGDCLAAYYWEATHGACVAACGNSSKLKVIDCIERSSKKIAKTSSCQGLPIPEDQSCFLGECKPAFESSIMPPAYALGCYNDIPTPRRVPIYLDSYRHQYNRDNTSHMIKECGEKAHTLGYEYFALQFHGECWAGDESTAFSYYLNGAAHNCHNGVGAQASNFVYKIGRPKVVKGLPPVTKLGCYRDDLMSPRPVPTHLDNLRGFIDWSKPSYNLPSIIAKCAASTQHRNFKTFALQYYGECWSGETADKSYSRGGVSARCTKGVGTINEYYVYQFYVET